MHTLEEIKCEGTVSVIKLHGEGTVKCRIMGMGITKGAEVYVHRVAPLGDPVEVNMRGCELPLGEADVEVIEVQQGLLFFR